MTTTTTSLAPRHSRRLFTGLLIGLLFGVGGGVACGVIYAEPLRDVAKRVFSRAQSTETEADATPDPEALLRQLTQHRRNLSDRRADIADQIEQNGIAMNILKKRGVPQDHPDTRAVRTESEKLEAELARIDRADAEARSFASRVRSELRAKEAVSNQPGLDPKLRTEVYTWLTRREAGVE